MKSNVLKGLKDLLKYVIYRNELAPFPIFDTEYVQEIQKKIKKVESNEYDKLPVIACKHCKSLHIINDEVENDVCVRCGAINETIIYSNIEEYMKDTKNKVY